MKKLKSILAIFSLSFVCLVSFIIGCTSETKNPDETIGIYNLKQVAIFYTDREPHSPPIIYDINYEDNDNTVIKELSQIIYNEYHHYQYAVKKNSDNYVFEKRVLDEQTGNYATTEAITVLNVEWDALNSEFILKTTISGRWYYLPFYNGNVYFSPDNLNVANTDFENIKLKSFMLENNIEAIKVRYALENN